MRRGEIENRFDPFYYIPELVALEKKVKAKSSARLRDFILRMAGGATPSVSEEEKYYADSSTGIPLVRVQNLNPSAELNLNDLKYINRATHEGLLLRSQVKGGDLLVKITGVGRMAVSGVPPAGFEGNINQHIVVIKTSGRRTSEALAAFLNTDIGEKLASRRSTGGTRPALDYPALRSIPVIFDERFVEIFKSAHAEKARKEAEARNLLTSIDGYVLAQLGIEPPRAKDNSLQSRMFYTKASAVVGERFDPDSLHPERQNAIKAILTGKFPAEHLHSVARIVRIITDENAEQLPYVGLENVENNYGLYLVNQEPPSFGTANVFKRGQVLFPKLRPYLNKVFHAPFDGVCSTEFHVLDGFRVSNQFLAHFLRTSVVVAQTKRLMTGNTLPRLQTKDIEALLIPIPPPHLQDEITSHIVKLHQQAKQLRAEGQAAIERAKQEVEAMILDSESSH